MNPPIPSEEMRVMVAEFVAKSGSEIVVEVGVDQGGLSEKLAVIPVVKELHLVDPWIPCKDFPDARVKAGREKVTIWARTQPKVRILVMESLEAARHHFKPQSVDFVFIDALHDETNVFKDIAAWLPVVRIGGILAGDDYQMEDVKKAVSKVLKDKFKLLEEPERFWYDGKRPGSQRVWYHEKMA